MSWSLNEIESLARKATRGAGYSWGLAEEAGKATRWLCAAGLPGAEALAEWLSQANCADYTDLCPDCTGTHWQAKGGTLCPLITGSALCDRAGQLANGATITLGATAHPMLLIPYVASASDTSGAGISISWPGLMMTRLNRETCLSASQGAIAQHKPDTITLTGCNTQTGDRIRRAYRGTITESAMVVLSKFAHRTYAPDTPESRLSGAGAGLTDND